MKIEEFLKNGKDIVIELYDGVEYLIDNDAEKAIKDGSTQVMLVRLFDRVRHQINTKEIEESLRINGAVDYLDKRPNKFATIKIKFPTTVRQFSLREGDSVSLHDLKAYDNDTAPPGNDFIHLVDIKDESIDLLAGNVNLEIRLGMSENIDIGREQYDISLVKIGVTVS